MYHTLTLVEIAYYSCSRSEVLRFHVAFAVDKNIISRQLTVTKNMNTVSHSFEGKISIEIAAP